MKLLSVTIPCYNSQDYMEHCIETLLTGGDDVEILIVDDGSRMLQQRLLTVIRRNILLLLRQSIRKMVDTVQL